MNVGIVGLGFVGGAMYKSFQEKSVSNIKVYDKFKDGGIGSLQNCYECDIVFLCLPTLFNNKMSEYDKSAIYDICNQLKMNDFKGVVVVKSTVEPETIYDLENIFNLNFIHNPEFLTARTAYDDFHNQSHIILGKGKKCDNNKFHMVEDFYRKYYPSALISLCTALESESMKMFTNCFYAVKVQFFTELYLTCKKNGSDFELIRELMLRNKWINPMHTNIPGPDGQISYGGMCFPKDTCALNQYMRRIEVPNSVLNATVQERTMMREPEFIPQPTKEVTFLSTKMLK